MCEHKETQKVFTLKNEIEAETTLDFMFYCPKYNDHLINTVVAYASREKITDEAGMPLYTHFAHVEISFPVSIHMERFEHSNSMAFSITQAQPLFFRLKHWRPEYYKLSMTVPVSKYVSLYLHCQALCEHTVKFDQYGMYAAAFAPESVVANRTRHEHGTFCSKIIMEVMLHNNIAVEHLRDVKPYRCTPSLLYKLISEPG